jgi:phage gpG-like protein
VNELRQLARDLKSWANQLRDPSALLKQCSEVMAQSVKENIRGGHDPNGAAFEPLKSRTGTPLFNTGGLFESIHGTSSTFTATAGSDISWAWVHDQGYFFPERRRGPGEKPWVFTTADGATVFTKRIRAHELPQRQFCGWGEPLVNTVVGLTADWVMSGFSG